MSLNIKPIAGTENRVVVEAAAAEEKTASGIFIPDTAKEKPQKGTVISVSEEDGKGKKPTVAPGDTVLYGKYAGTEITYEGKEYLIMRETDIYAVLS
jgi:chaperonin GroES